MTRTHIKMLVAGGLIIYPIAIYFAGDHLSPSQLLAGLLLLLATRLLIAAYIDPVKRFWSITLALLTLTAAALVSLFLPDIKLEYLRLYPMLLTLLVFAIFFGSLFTKMPLVERFARMTQPELPTEAVSYTRHVTWVWCGVLLCNALISLYTSVGTSLKTWSLYNGLIVYFLFGGVFVCEYYVRVHLQRRWTAA